MSKARISLSKTAQILCASVLALLLAGPVAAIEDDGLIPPTELPQGIPLNADELIRKYPADPRGRVLAANAALRACELKSAEREIRTALALAQKHPMFTNNTRLQTSMRRMLASVLAMSLQFDKALAEENILVQGAPDNTEFLYMRAQAYVQLKRLDEALADTDKILQIDANNFKGWQIRALILYQMKRFDEAVVATTIIASHTADYPPVILSMRGQAHAANGNYDRALTDYDAALDLARTQRAQGYSDEIVEQDIALKKSNAEAARKAEAATPKDAARIRAALFEKDQHSLLPTNALKCGGS